MNGPEKSDSLHSSSEACVKRSGARRRAAKWSLAGGTKENAWTSKPRSGRAEPGSRVTCAGSHTRSRKLRKQSTAANHTSCIMSASISFLRAGFFGLKKNAAPGVDGLTWTQYEEGLEAKPPKPSRACAWGEGIERWPPVDGIFRKADGRRRPLGIAALEDKIVQAAVAADPDAYLRRRSSWGSVTGSGLSVDSTIGAGRARVWAGEAADQLGPRRGYSVVLDVVSTSPQAY